MRSEAQRLIVNKIIRSRIERMAAEDAKTDMALMGLSVIIRGR